MFTVTWFGPLLEAHPDLFIDLDFKTGRDIAIDAWQLAGGGNGEAIERCHVEQALEDYRSALAVAEAEQACIDAAANDDGGSPHLEVVR